MDVSGLCHVPYGRSTPSKLGDRSIWSSETLWKSGIGTFDWPKSKPVYISRKFQLRIFTMFSELQMDLSPSLEGVGWPYGTWQSPETSIYDVTTTFRPAGQTSFEGKQKFQFFWSIYPFWLLYWINFRNPLYNVMSMIHHKPDLKTRTATFPDYRYEKRCFVPWDRTDFPKSHYPPTHSDSRTDSNWGYSRCQWLGDSKHWCGWRKLVGTRALFVFGSKDESMTIFHSLFTSRSFFQHSSDHCFF